MQNELKQVHKELVVSERRMKMLEDKEIEYLARKAKAAVANINGDGVPLKEIENSAPKVAWQENVDPAVPGKKEEEEKDISKKMAVVPYKEIKPSIAPLPPKKEEEEKKVVVVHKPIMTPLPNEEQKSTDLVQCKTCGRQFFRQIAEKHEKVCEKVKKSEKRPKFNSLIQRVGELLSSDAIEKMGKEPIPPM